MVFPNICIVEDKVVLHNTNVWENHDFENAIQDRSNWSDHFLSNIIR